MGEESCRHVIESPDEKESGAYYTPPDIAVFLVRWAVRSATDSVLDPSFGGGVFLWAAFAEIARRGGVPAEQVAGVEMSPPAFESVV